MHTLPINSFYNYPVKLPDKKPLIPPDNIKQAMLKGLNKHTLIIYKRGEIKTYNQRNLKPVFLALEDYNNDFSECFIADRRISKASAIIQAMPYIGFPMGIKSLKLLKEEI